MINHYNVISPDCNECEYVRFNCNAESGELEPFCNILDELESGDFDGDEISQNFNIPSVCPLNDIERIKNNKNITL